MAMAFIFKKRRFAPAIDRLPRQLNQKMDEYDLTKPPATKNVFNLQSQLLLRSQIIKWARYRSYRARDLPAFTPIV